MWFYHVIANVPVSNRMRKMATVVVLLLSFLWSMVYCQTFPYIDAQDGPLDYVENIYISLWCHTDLSTCCGSSHCGDWYFPNGTRVESGSWYITSYQVVILHQDYTSQSGIYCCRIPTEAIHNDSGISVRDTVCVGFYEKPCA